MAEMFKCLTLLPALLGFLSLLAWSFALFNTSWGFTASPSTGPSGEPGPKVYMRLGLFSAWRSEDGERETRVDIKQANGVLFAMGHVAVTGAAISSAAVALTTFTALVSPPCIGFCSSLTLQLLALVLMSAAWLGAVCALLLAGGPGALNIPVSVGAGALSLGGLSAFALWRLASTGGPAEPEDNEEEEERLMEDEIETD